VSHVSNMSLCAIYQPSAAVRAAWSAGETTRWVSVSSVVAGVPSAGSRGSVRMVVSAGQRAGSRTVAMSYQRIKVSSTMPANQPATGSASITITGSSLALTSHTAAVRVDASDAEATQWTSDSAVAAVCAMGVKGTKTSIVTLQQAVGSRTEAFSYAFVVLKRASDRTDCVSKGVELGLLNASTGE
jgi:hypothetical protein